MALFHALRFDLLAAPAFFLAPFASNLRSSCLPNFARRSRSWRSVLLKVPSCTGEWACSASETSVASFWGCALARLRDSLGSAARSYSSQAEPPFGRTARHEPWRIAVQLLISQ